MLKINSFRKHSWKIIFIAIFIFFAIPSVTSASTIFRAPSVDGLVGYWNFDIGAGGSVAYDMSGQGHNGTLTNMDPATDWVDGKVGSGALDFDGSNDYINIVNNTLFEDMVSNANVNKTLAIWFNADTLAAESVAHLHPSLMNKGNVYMNFGVDDSGEIAFMWYDGVTQRILTSGAGISTGLWYHAVVVLSEGTVTVYVNSVNKGSGSFTGLQAAAAGGLEWFGTTGGTQGTQRWDGKMDEARVYNRALSAGEIQRLYKATAGTKISKPPLSNGLVGYWNFDIGARESTVYDMSGQANHGTLTNMDPGTDWVDGKVGSGALDFDGSNDHINIPDSSDWDLFGSNTGGATLSLWVKHNSWNTTDTYIGHRQDDSNAWWIQHDAGGTMWFGIYTTGFIVQTPAGGAITDTNWHHITMVKNENVYTLSLDGIVAGTVTDDSTAVFTGPLFIGDMPSLPATPVYPFPGLIDDVRIYNRALSASEIQRLYKATAGTKISKLPFLPKGLVGYWDLNDGAGSAVAKDKSGQGHNGTLTLMDPATDWVDGKIGSGALDFDGTNDYVDMGSQPDLRFNSGNFTIAGWVKPDDVTLTKTLVANYIDTNLGYFFGIFNSEIGYYSNAWKSANTTLSTGIWYHIAITIDSSGNYIMYLNGAVDGSGSSVLPVAGENTFKIGAYGTSGGLGRFDGLIDEARVYNRALSASEIQLLYDLGNLKP